MKKDLTGKKVLVLGISKSGCSAAKYLNSKNIECRVSEYGQLTEEQKEMASELESLGIKTESGGHSEKFMENIDLAIVSPGIPPHAEIYERLKNKNIPAISEIELAYLQTNVPFVGITGTNGKTTTTALISYILEYENEGTAPKCGNIGIAPTSLLNRENINYFVCELSSYQLEMSPTFCAYIGCFLNFTPDHISWHGSLENYFKAKAKLFDTDKKPKFAIFNALDKKVCELAKNFSDDEVYFFGKETSKNCCYTKGNSIWFKKDGNEEKIIDLNDTKLVGEHNYQNIECAILVAKIIGLENEKIKEAIKTFEPMEHRCEFCGTINGIEFYNDSKATNPESSIVAINSFEGKTVTLIAGGRDKNTSLDEFCESIKERINDTILIGEATERFAENLKNINYNSIHYSKTLEEAIEKSIELNNQVTLLSPACASFDMFKSFEHRGDVFKEYVRSKIS